VHDPGRRRLQRHRPPDPPGRGQRPLQPAGHLRRHHRQAPVTEQRQPLGLAQRPAALVQPPPPPLPGTPGPDLDRPPWRRLGRLGRGPGRGRGVGEEVAVGEQVAQGGQAGAGAFQDGDAGGAQGGRLGPVDGRGQVGEHGHRLVGRGGGLGGQAGVAGVGGGLGGQVQVEGQGGGGRVLQQGPDAGGEDAVGVVAGAPGVQRVGGGQAGLEHGGQPPAGRLGDIGQGHPQPLGQVEQVGPLPSGVVDGGQPARMGPAPGQQLAGVGQLVQGGHPGHPVGVEQGLVGAVLAGQGAGVGGHHGPGRPAPADLEGDHRDGPGGRLGQGGPERRRLPDRLQEQGHHPGAGQLQGVVEVGGGAGHELVAGRDDQVEPEPAVVVEQGREHRPGVADHRHRAGGQVGRLGIPTHPQALLEVEEPHAVAAAHHHPGRLGDRREALGQWLGTVGGGPGGRLLPPRWVVLQAAGEDHRRRDPGGRGRLQLGLQGGVGHGQHGQVDRAGQVGQGPVAGAAGHLPVAGVDQVDRAPVAAGEQLADQLVPERRGPGAGPDHRHRPGLEQGGEREPAAGALRHRGERARPAHRRRVAFLRSAITARTACQPGMPQTPPPPWVAELAW
jgi:hypothetical protein